MASERLRQMLSEVDPVVLDYVRSGHIAGVDTSDGGAGGDDSGLHEGLHAAGDAVGAAAVGWMTWRSWQGARTWLREKQAAAAEGPARSDGRRVPPAGAGPPGTPDVEDPTSARDAKGVRAEPRLKRSVLLDLARRELIEEFDLPENEPLEVREQEYEPGESAWRFVFESGSDVYEVLVVAKGSRAAVVNYNHTRE